MTQFYTYLHCKPDGTPFYVGKGSGRRFNLYFGRNTHHNHVVKKYGEKNIKIYVFNCDTEDQAFSDEIQQIAQFRNDGIELANYSNGGEGPSGNSLSDSTKQKIGMFHKGKIVSLETRLKMSLAKKGIPINKESVKKSSLSRTGTHRSDETKHKISLSLLGKKKTQETRDKMSKYQRSKKEKKCLINI